MVTGSDAIHASRGRRQRDDRLRPRRLRQRRSARCGCWPEATPRPGGPRSAPRPIARRSRARRPDRIRVTTRPADLSNCDLVVEAVIEELDAKVELLRDARRCLPRGRPGDDDLVALDGRAGDARAGMPTGSSASTSSTPCTGWSWWSSASPTGVREGVRERARAWCRALGKTAIEVPDQPGFVVNRLLFPYLFDAVRLMERTGMSAADVDSCMQLGRRPPDGAAAPARLHRARRRRGDRREPVRRHGGGALPGPRADRRADRRPAGSAARARPASTSTTERYY